MFSGKKLEAQNFCLLFRRRGSRESSKTRTQESLSLEDKIKEPSSQSRGRWWTSVTSLKMIDQETTFIPFWELFWLYFLVIAATDSRDWQRKREVYLRKDLPSLDSNFEWRSRVNCSLHLMSVSSSLSLPLSCGWSRTSSRSNVWAGGYFNMESMHYVSLLFSSLLLSNGHSSRSSSSTGEKKERGK